MDNNKSYNLLMITKKLAITFILIFLVNQFSVADSKEKTTAIDNLAEINKLKNENDLITQKLSDEKQLSSELKEEILVLSHENLSKELSIENRNFFIFTVLIFSLVALLLFYMLYRSIKKAKHNNKTLQQRNKEIDNQKRELEELNRLKIKFFSIISHDIRSPLLSLKGVLNLFDANLLNDKTETTEFFTQLNTEFNATANLLDNLLIWAKKQMYEESIEKISFPINTVINDNLNLLNATILKRNIAIFNLLSDDIYVYADKEMINMVVRNLIGNALKFTPNTGQISIFYKISDDFLEVGIRDTGIGISNDQIRKIFDANFYSTNGLNDEKGNGLGLMLCREFIEKSNGKLWIESKIGVGSTFFFTLPLFKTNHANNIQRNTASVSAAVEPFI